MPACALEYVHDTVSNRAAGYLVIKLLVEAPGCFGDFNPRDRRPRTVSVLRRASMYLDSIVTINDSSHHHGQQAESVTGRRGTTE